MSDRILGGFGVVLAAFYIWQATLVEESFISDPIGPKAFPIIIGVLLGAASLVIVLRPDSEPQWPALPKLFDILLAAAVMVAYAQLLPMVGFVVATAVAAAYLAWRFRAGVVRAMVAGLAISGGIYVVFHLALGLSLARGPLGF
jgi:putative tricarboxylic transport membrane protein